MSRKPDPLDWLVYFSSKKNLKEKSMSSSHIMKVFSCDYKHYVTSDDLWSDGYRAVNMNTLKIDTKWGGHFTREEAEETLRKYKEKCMKEVKKDVVQFEMGTDGNGNTQSKLSPDSVMFSYSDWDESEHLKPDTQYAVRMVAVPDGYRIATAEEAAKCDPLGCKFLDSTGSWASVARPKGLCMDYKDATYVVPKETEEDRKNRKIMDRIEAAEKELAVAKEELNKGE